jgi:thioredoxin reductase
MNKPYDIIIIGDSVEGFKAMKQLASSSCKIKIAFVSRDFKSTTTRDFLNVDYITEEVVLVDYRARLFSCYLKNGPCIFSTHLILSSGIKYAPYLVNGKQVPSVFNTTKNINRFAKTLPAVVVGQDAGAAKLAMAVAKKYKQVYLCMNSINLNCTETIKSKLNTIDNIVLLPNATITKVHVSNNMLTAVELSNYSKITCNAIFVKTTASPDIDFIQNNIILKDTDGYCVTSENAESTIVPKCYAIGACAAKSTAKKQDAMINSIITELMEV